MDTAEALIKLLYTYGPFAILVFLVFVTERKTRSAWKEAGRDEKQRMMMVYLLNWAVIFGLVLFSMYAWTRINLNDEPTIKGRIENLSGREVISTGSAFFYVHRVYVVPGRAEYMWRLVGPKRFTDGEKIMIVLDPNDPNLGEAGITNNELTIKKAFYDREVRISYRRDLNKLFVDDGGQQVELPQSQQMIADKPEPKWLDFLSTTAFAQGSFQSAPYVSSLESPDPVIRRNARGDLARQGAAAVPWIEECWSCEEYGEGTFNLRVAKAGGVADGVSQIEVFRAQVQQRAR